jgi:hypothetical protein
MRRWPGRSLAIGGQRGQVDFDDPWPLSVGHDCIERDVFALPTRKPH